MDVLSGYWLENPWRDSISIFQNACGTGTDVYWKITGTFFVGMDKFSLVDMCRRLMKKPFGWTAFKMLVGIVAGGYWKDLIGGTSCL
jgi:hypothetical protein